MNHNGLKAAAATAALFACAEVQARVQPPTTASPKLPTAPRSRSAGSVSASASVRVNKALSTAMAQVREADARTADTLTQYAQTLSGRSFNSLPEKRQDINIVDVPLKEALKRVLEDSKMPYVLDDDVPNEPKVTIKLTNAPLATILDALTLSNRIGWRTELKQTTTTSSTIKPTEQSNKIKAETDIRTGATGTFFYPVVVGAGFVMQIHVGKTITAMPSSFSFRAVTIPGPPASDPQPFLRGGATTDSPQLRIYRWQTQKRTFTCPRCHNSISILQEHKDIKCTKCQRNFEDSWKVCPYDGTKRPESKTAWKYCPICGKGITLEASWSEPMGLTDFLHFTAPVDFEIEQPFARTLQYLPSLMNEIDGHSGHGCGDHEHEEHTRDAVSA